MATVSDGYVRSSFCTESACVEVRQMPDGMVEISPGPHTREEFAAFLAGAKAGEFDDLALDG